MHWIWFILAGLIVGALGRLIHPGHDPIGLLMTLAVGIVAMLIAAAISSGWLAFLIGVFIAALLVALISRFSGGYRRSGVFR
ncbi:MAG: GlsB/YeaQ/YmgE family stress response membrane protein [Gaiellaceae bacterium]